MKQLILLILLLIAAIGVSAQTTFNRFGNHVAIELGGTKHYINCNANIKADASNSNYIIITEESNYNTPKGIKFDFESVTEFACTNRAECIDSIFITYFQTPYQIYVSDQTTRAIFVNLHRLTSSAYELAYATVPDKNYIVLSNVTGLTVSDSIFLFQDHDTPALFCAKILSISNDTIFIDSPIDQIFDPVSNSTELYTFNCNAAIDGSNTRKILEFTNNSHVPIDITRMIFHLTDVLTFNVKLEGHYTDEF